MKKNSWAIGGAAPRPPSKYAHEHSQLMAATGKMRTCGRADFLDLKMTKPNYKPNTGPISNLNANLTLNKP